MENDEIKIEPIDLSDILKDYEDKWVILSEDDKMVIASGDSIDKLAEHIYKGVIFKVPRFDAILIPLVDGLH